MVAEMEEEEVEVEEAVVDAKMFKIPSILSYSATTSCKSLQ